MFDDFVWPEDQVDHIARHGVTPEEFEEVCSGKCLLDKTKSKGQNPVYLAYGQTEAGRYLFCAVIRFPDGNGYPIRRAAGTNLPRQRPGERRGVSPTW